jgi:hypothetical protein
MGFSVSLLQSSLSCGRTSRKTYQSSHGAPSCLLRHGLFRLWEGCQALGGTRLPAKPFHNQSTRGHGLELASLQVFPLRSIRSSKNPPSCSLFSPTSTKQTPPEIILEGAESRSGVEIPKTIYYSVNCEYVHTSVTPPLLVRPIYQCRFLRRPVTGCLCMVTRM